MQNSVYIIFEQGCISTYIMGTWLDILRYIYHNIHPWMLDMYIHSVFSYMMYALIQFVLQIEQPVINWVANRSGARWHKESEVKREDT